MASIVKDSKGRSPFWTACYTDAAGRRLKKSTKTKNRDEALRIALQLERAARLAGTGELTEVRARELISELLEQVTDGRESVRVVSTKAFFTGWLASKKALLASGSLFSYEAATTGFLEFLGPRATRPLAAVQTQDLQGFITELVRRDLSPRTCAVYLKVLRSVFKAARLQQLITFNPAEAVELPRGISAERGTFTPAEVSLLVKAATDEWRTVILLGAFTGQRLRDCCNAEWSLVDFTTGTITFRVMKRGGKKLVVPMHPQLRAHLERIAGDTAEKYLAPSLANRSTGGKSGLSMEFAKIMKAAGIEAGEADVSGKRKMASRSFHSLRHGFVSGLANAGVAEDVRMALSGHTTKAVHQGYTHRELATLAEAMAKLPKLEE